MSNLQDGYGDDETTDEIIARFEKWSHAVAGHITDPYGPDYDDLVQESLISIWKSLEKNEGAPNAVYLTKTAKYRMLSVKTGSPLTGGDSTPGAKYRPRTVGVDWDAIESGEEDTTWASLLEAADLLDGVTWAYHDGEIMDALSSLKPQHREYVVRKFWHGQRDVEIAQDMNVDRKLLGTWWRRTIKPALVKHLNHLQEV